MKYLDKKLLEELVNGPSILLQSLHETIFEIRIFIRIGSSSICTLYVNEKRFFEITFFSAKRSSAAGKPGLSSKILKFLASSNFRKHYH